MIFIFFILGLCIGSFLNVVIDRLPRKESIVFGNSHCEFCKHTLAWYDLVPLISYMTVKGKCRYCRKFIGYRYPLIEITTGVLFVVAYLFVGFVFPLLLFVLGIISCLIVLFYIDLFHGILPDSILISLLGFSILQKLFIPTQWLSSILTGSSTGIGFLLLYLLTKKKGIGFGDVKYAFVMGFLLGFPFIVPSLYIAFLTGASAALILVIEGKKKFKSSIPFGPFLVLGTLANLFWGQQLWTIFQRILGI